MNRAQWNRLASRFESEACDIAREESGAAVRRSFELARLPKTGGVLVDMGCGIGTFIREYGPRFAEIVGVEYAPDILARAKQRCAHMDHVTWYNCGAAQAAKRIGARADVTVCMNVITSSNGATRAAIWRGLAAVTKPGGFALVVVPSIESDAMVEQETNGKKPRKTKQRAKGLVWRSDAWQKHFAQDELSRNLGRAGFMLRDMSRAHYPWSIEGMRETKARRLRRPWDWIVLAQRAN
jgi:2-polyprenyl-3-methyl-5-hydroxy-6-metoxy-1,4-benzoquinol methylase